MIIAGGEHQQLVTVFGVDPGIVKRGGLDLLHILAEHRLVGEVEVFVVPKHPALFLVVDPAEERCYYYIFALLIQGVKADHWMIFPKIFIGVPGKLPEHCLILHVVTVDQITVPISGAISIQKRDSAAGIGTVKSAVQIVCDLCFS